MNKPIRILAATVVLGSIAFAAAVTYTNRSPAQAALPHILPEGMQVYRGEGGRPSDAASMLTSRREYSWWSTYRAPVNAMYAAAGALVLLAVGICVPVALRSLSTERALRDDKARLAQQRAEGEAKTRARAMART